MIDPLKIFKTEKVKDLLSEFYEGNFVKAGVPDGIGKEIVERVWAQKDSENIEDLRKEVASLFEIAKKAANSGIDEIDLWTLFDFSKAKSFLDVGANKLRYLNEVGYKYPNIERLIGIDVIPKANEFNYPERSEYYQVDENAEQFPLEDNSIDVINIQFVFHHFIDDQAIDRMLNNCYRALSSGGQLILWEETFESNLDVDFLVQNNKTSGINAHPEWTQIYYDFSEEEKWEFIIANDWIINVNNAHMQWSGMYKSWDEWKQELTDHGYNLSEYFNLGLRYNGIIKQGVHMIGVFSKQS